MTTFRASPPSGAVVRAGVFAGRHRDYLSGEWTAIVRWGGDEHDSIVSFDRLQHTPDDALTPLELHQQFAADVSTIWANWTSARLSEEDAMTAIRDRHIELSDALKEIP